MAIRQNTILIKGSNVPGKIPSPGDLQLKELALNFADVILYASGTTANSILPIGWDRVARTGDTMTGTLYVPTLSANTISANTLDVNGAFKYTDGAQASGRILTSDGSGNASWQAQSNVGNLIYFFTNTASDISTYLQAVSTPQTGNLQTITNLGVTDGTLLITFATLSGGTGYDFFPSGIVNLHIHAAVTNSNPKPTQLYFKLYKRTSGGTETLLGTSDNTSTISGIQAEYNTDLPISAITASTSDRLIIKVYASVGAGGPDPDINLYVDGSTISRIQFPSFAIDTSNFIPYTGATKNTSLGIYNITANGIISTDGLTANTISATTYAGLPTDIRVTGGTYTAGTATYTNNTGGTFTVTGFTTTDTYVTGFAYNNNNLFTITNSTGGTLSVLANTMSGLTVNGALSVTGATTSNSLSATTLSSTTLTVSGITFNKLLKEKVGSVAGSGFTGNPKTYALTFGTNFADTNYAIMITGPANRTYTYESQATSGFTINANANGAITGNVYWIAKQIGEV